MKISAIIISLFLSSSLMAEHDGHKHHNLSAHEHGVVKLAFALEGKTIDIEVDGPSESFLGFEHKPTSTDDKLAYNRASELWNKEILTKVIMFPSNLNCQIETSKFIQNFSDPAETKNKKSGEHSEIEATAKLTCNGGSFKGADVKIGLKDKFPNIKKLKLDIIDADKTKSLDIKKAIETVRL
jgi:hypothetical protein